VKINAIKVGKRIVSYFVKISKYFEKVNKIA